MASHVGPLKYALWCLFELVNIDNRLSSGRYSVGVGKIGNYQCKDTSECTYGRPASGEILGRGVA